MKKLRKLKSMYRVLAPCMANDVRVDKVLELAICHMKRTGKILRVPMDLYLIGVADDFCRAGVQQFRDGMGLRMCNGISPCLSPFSWGGICHAITKLVLICCRKFIFSSLSFSGGIKCILEATRTGWYNFLLVVNHQHLSVTENGDGGERSFIPRGIWGHDPREI